MPKARLLIVEDQAITAQDLKFTLEELGYEVCGIAYTGDDALRQAEVSAPDLVLMDIILRGPMTGVEAAEKIRSKHRIPVVFVTAFANVELLERAREAEPYGYVVKPFTPQALRAAIEMALYNRQMDEKLHHLNAVLRAIRNVNQLITKERDRSRLIERACYLLVEAGCYTSAHIVLIDSEGRPTEAADCGGGQVLPTAAELCDDRTLGALRALLSLPGVGVFENFGAQPEVRPLLSSCAGCTVMSARMEFEDRLFGLLLVCLGKSTPSGEEEQELLREVASDLAFALHGIELEAARRESE